MLFSYLRLIPRPLRAAIYGKLVDELQRIEERDVAAFAAKVLAAARRILSL